MSVSSAYAQTPELFLDVPEGKQVWTHEQFVLDSGTYFRFVSDTSGFFYPQFIDNILVTEIP